MDNHVEVKQPAPTPGFTPGPWSVKQFHEPDRCIPAVLAGNDLVGLEVCTLFGGGYPNKDECQANARLIAAAPCMFAVLDQFVRQTEEVGTTRNYPLYKAARAALAKAGGE